MRRADLGGSGDGCRGIPPLLLVTHSEHDVRALSGEHPRGLEADATVGAGDDDRGAGEVRRAIRRPGGGQARAVTVMAAVDPKPRAMSQMAKKISNRPP